MLNRVYYWAEHKEASGESDVGHSSLDIAFGCGPGSAEYVSWWPGSSVFGGTGTPNGNYVDDRTAEGQDATAVVDLYCLDEAAMRARWLVWKKNNYYSFLGKNCAACVADLLYEGGAKYNKILNDYCSYVIVWEPISTYNYARAISALAADIMKSRGA